MAKPKSKLVRYRLSIPMDDQAVIAWLEQQRSVSQSIRVIVKEAIPKHGYGDLFSSAAPDGLNLDWDNAGDGKSGESGQGLGDTSGQAPTRNARQPKATPQAAPQIPIPKPSTDTGNSGAGISMGDDIFADFGIDDTYSSNDHVDDIKKMMSRG